MKRPYHHGDLRRALIAAALDVVRTEGADGLTLRAVATRAGVSVMAPYRHFTDKAALEAAVAEHGFGLLRERLSAARCAGDPRRRLVEFGVAYVLFAKEETGLFRMMFGREPPAGRRPSADLAADPDTVYGAFSEELAAVFPTEELDLARTATWSFVHGLAMLVADGRMTPAVPDIERLVRDTGAFVIDRLAPREDQPRQASTRSPAAD